MVAKKAVHLAAGWVANLVELLVVSTAELKAVHWAAHSVPMMVESLAGN